MSRKCPISGKKGSTGNNRSHSNRATNRDFKINRVVARVFDEKTGKVKKMKIAASTLRTLTKKGKAF